MLLHYYMQGRGWDLHFIEYVFKEHFIVYVSDLFFSIDYYWFFIFVIFSYIKYLILMFVFDI